MKPISKFTGRYRFLSNFYRQSFTVDGITYRTMEHFYQSHKTPHELEFVSILMAKSPAEAKKYGKTCCLFPCWEEKKQKVMLEGLRAKFALPTLKKKLLRTGTAELIEGNTWGDMYWGMYGQRGSNNLGKLLMQVREEMKNG